MDGKFRPQTFPLGLHENGERKLELTVDVGEPGERALQVSAKHVKRPNMLGSYLQSRVRTLIFPFPSFTCCSLPTRRAQIRQLDNEKWSRWSEAYAVQVSKSSTPSTKLLKKKTTAKAETGAIA